MIDKFYYVHAWNFDTWMEMLTRASNKMRFEYCLDARGEPQDMRSVQGHEDRDEEQLVEDSRWCQYRGLAVDQVAECASDRNRTAFRPFVVVVRAIRSSLHMNSTTPGATCGGW